MYSMYYYIAIYYNFFEGFSNFWINFGKLWEARSRLYRNESLQVNTRWKALDEIYLRPCVVKMNERKNGTGGKREKRKLWKYKRKNKVATRFTTVCTAPHSKIQPNFVKHFRIFIVSFSKFHSFFAIFVQISPILKNFFRNFRKFYGKDQNLLDSQVSWDFAPKIVDFFR